MVLDNEPKTTEPADAIPSKGLAPGLQKHLVVMSLRVDQKNDCSLAEDLDVLDGMSVLGALHCQLRILRAWPRLPTLPRECHSGFLLLFIVACWTTGSIFFGKPSDPARYPSSVLNKCCLNGRPRLFWR